MIDGIELLTLHERRAPNGAACLMGFFGSICVTVTKDQAKPGAWRLAIHDLARAGYREDAASRARAISAPVDDADRNVVGDDFDDLPADCE